MSEVFFHGLHIFCEARTIGADDAFACGFHGLELPMNDLCIVCFQLNIKNTARMHTRNAGESRE